MALEVNSQGARLVLKAPSLFFWRRAHRPHESERVLLARVHLNKQYTGSNARQPDWCLHHVVRRRWKKPASLDWVTSCEKKAKHCQELLNVLGLQSCQCVKKKALSRLLFPHKPLLPSKEASLQDRTGLCFSFVQIITCCYPVIKYNFQSVLSHCYLRIELCNKIKPDLTPGFVCHVTQQHNQETNIIEDKRYCKCWACSQDSTWYWYSRQVLADYYLYCATPLKTPSSKFTRACRIVGDQCGRGDSKVLTSAVLHHHQQAGEAIYTSALQMINTKAPSYCQVCCSLFGCVLLIQGRAFSPPLRPMRV